MSNDIIIKIGADSGGAEKTIGQLRNEFKSLQNELQKTQVGTEQYRKVLGKLGEVKGEIKDVREGIAMLDPSSRAKLFSNAFSAMTGAVQGLSGALSLVGVENEKIIGVAQVMQGAMNMSAGIQSIADLRKAFDLLKVSLLANPIMLLATVVAGIGISFFLLKDKIKIIGDAFDYLGNIVKGFLDTLGIIDLEKDKQVEKTKKVINTTNEEMKAYDKAAQRELEILKAKGENSNKIELEVLNKKLELRRRALQEQLKLAEISGDVDKEAVQKIKDEIDDITHQITLKTIEIDNEQKKSEEDRRRNFIENLNKRAESINSFYEKQRNSLKESVNFEIEKMQIAGSSDEQIFQKKVKLLQDELQLIKEQEKNLSKIKTEENKKRLEELKEQQIEINRAIELEQLKHQADMSKKAEDGYNETIQRDISSFEMKKQNLIEEFEMRSQISSLIEEGAISQLQIEKDKINSILAMNNEYIQSISDIGTQATDDQIKLKEKLIKENEKLNNALKINELKTQKEITKLRINEQNLYVKTVQSGITSIKGLSDNLFKFMENISNKDIQSKKNAAKTKFNIDKSLNIVQIIMDTATSVMKALKDYPPVVNFVMSGLMAAMGATQLAVVASQKFNEDASGGSVSAPSAPSAAPSVTPSAAPTTQQQNFTPTFISTENLPKTEDPKKNISIVVEDDIDNVNKRLSYIQKIKTYK